MLRSLLRARCRCSTHPVVHSAPRRIAATSRIYHVQQSAASFSSTSSLHRQQDDTVTSSSSSSSSKKTTLYMWGTDTKGSLLKPPERVDESMLDVPTAVDLPRHFATDADSSSIVDDASLIQKIVCGATDTAILTADGTCFVAGENKQGQLGLGHTNPVPQLERLNLEPVVPPDEAADSSSNSSSTAISDLALGSVTSALIQKATGDLYTAGWGGSVTQGFGVLGQGEGESCLVPQRVDSLVEDGCRVAQVQLGEYHMTVLTTEGEILTCGVGSYGRLGNFETTDQLYLEPIELLTGGVTQISGGKSFTLALTEDGVLYGWGRNHKGQLGTGLGLAVDMYAMASVAEPIETDELLGRQVTRVAAGHSHAACITASGELFFWGMSLHLEPVRVDSLLHTKVVDVACGEDYTLAVDQDGKLYSFGIGKTGVLGQGSVRRSNQAVVLEALEGKKVVQVSAGWKHAACLVEEDE